MSKPSYVPVDVAARTAGRAPTVIYRMALTGDLPYTVCPDKRVLFERSAVEALNLGPARSRRERQAAGA